MTTAELDAWLVPLLGLGPHDWEPQDWWAGESLKDVGYTAWVCPACGACCLTATN